MALSESQQVLKDAQAAFDSTMMKRSHFINGTILFRMGDMDMALQEYNLSASYIKPLYQKFEMITYNLNTGAVYSKLGLFDPALERFDRVIQFAEAISDTTVLMQALVNTANIHAKTKQFDAAIMDYNRVLSIAESANNRQGIMYSLMNMGTLFLDMGDIERSEDKLLQALTIALDEAVFGEYNYIVEMLTNVYKKSGNKDRHIEFLEMQTGQIEALLTRRQDLVLDDLKNMYELELKQRELENVQLEVTSHRRMMVGGGIFLLTVFGGYLIYLFKRNKALRLLYERNLELLNQFSIPRALLEGAHENQDDDSENTEEPLKKVFIKIKRAMDEDKLFKQPDLSIAVLSTYVSSNEKYTSSAISTYANMNFNKFVNFHRINEAKRLLILKGKKSVVSDILDHCGYASRSTFYKAFSEFTGMTPKEFVSMAEKENQESR